MKFQKYLRDVQRSSNMLRHLNYKALKSEIRRLQELVETGGLSDAAAAELFGRRLELELVEVGHCWEACLWDLGRLVKDFFAGVDLVLSGDAAHGALCAPEGPIRLLEPLNQWLPIAALADALRRHRLLQVTAAVKIEKKFVKVFNVSLGPGCSAAALLQRSPLSGGTLHTLCHELGAAGDALLRLGLGAAEPEPCDSCPICLTDMVDPARLPCGHRVCIHCVLPLFGGPRHAERPGQDDEATLLRCPLCRAAGPQTPQALCLDSLLQRLGRGLSPQLGVNVPAGAEELPQFTAVVASSLAALAAREAEPAGLEPPPTRIRRSRSLMPTTLPPTCKQPYTAWGGTPGQEPIDAGWS